MSDSILRRLRRVSAAARRAYFKTLDEGQKRQIALGVAWWFVGRPEQMPPPGRWRWWLICAGRGWGKPERARSGAQPKPVGTPALA